MLSLHVIQIYFTTPNHQEGNSLVQRFHLTLLEHYRLLNEQYPNDTDLILYAIMAYNSTIHSSTGFTPFELIIYGHTDLRKPFTIREQIHVSEIF